MSDNCEICRVFINAGQHSHAGGEELNSACTRLFLEWVGWIAAEEHREKAPLALHPNDVARPDGIRLAALTSSLRDDLKVWAFDHLRVDVVHVSWRHIVNIFVQVADADSVAKLRHQPRD